MTANITIDQTIDIMKPTLNISKSEQQANQLWANFNRRQQDKFWQKYERLLVQHTTLHTPIKPALPKTTKSKTPYVEKTFPTFKWMGQLFGVWLLVAFTLVFAMLHSEVWFLSMFIVVALHICFRIHKGINHIKITPHSLVIKQGVLGFRKSLAWKHIDRVLLKETHNSFCTLYNLRITRQDGKTYDLNLFFRKQLKSHFSKALAEKGFGM